MYLSFILLHILGNNSRNSRLSGFNSRLGQPKFLVGVATGICPQSVDLAGDFSGKTAVSWPKSKKFPVQREKPGLHAFSVRR
jgi:hypothetical protein